jgi:hypothetical protein
MGDIVMNFGFMDAKAFEDLLEARAKQKYNHIRGAVLIESMFPAPDRVDPEKFKPLDERIRAINSKGMVADLILGEGNRQLTRMFPGWQERARYMKYIVSRYAAMNVSWQVVDAFEDYENGRELMKELGGLLKKLDPYGHPRSTGARETSAPLLEDGWMDHILYRSDDDQLGAIENQLYAVPSVNLGGAANMDANAYRRRIWNAAMSGQYISLRVPEGGGAFGAAWYDFFSASRHWDLEPYYDVDGGRATALPDVEYLIYVEKPGSVEIAIQKRGYDIAWYNPRTGEFLKQKDFKGEKFLGEPPDKSGDWVLRVSREETKADMLKSYRFEARTPVLQEAEQSAARLPFEIAEPAGDEIKLSAPAPYAAKLKRETRATRSMMYLWTGEVAADGQGYRVLGSGAKGTLRIPPDMVKKLPAVMHLRLSGMNANGKVYSADKIVQLTK